MKKLYVHSFASWFVGILLTEPAAYVIVISVLKSMWGGHLLFDTPWLIPGRGYYRIDLDFKLLIPFGPMLAFFGRNNGAALAL